MVLYKHKYRKEGFNMKGIKHIISIITSIAILLCISSTNISYGYSDKEIFVTKVLLNKLTDDSIDYMSTNISSGLPVQQIKSRNICSEAFAVIQSEAVKYILFVSCYNNSYSATILNTNSLILNNAFKNGDKVTIMQKESNYYIGINGILYDFESNYVSDYNQSTYNSYNIDIDHSFWENASKIPNCCSSFYSGKMLYVDFIKNVEINGSYVCWAACAASKINYQCDNWNFDATGIYYYALNGYTGKKVGDPEGKSLRYIYDEYLPGTMIIDKRLTTTGVYNCLNAGKPIQIYLNDYVNKKGHSVIINGVKIYNDMTKFVLMDPGINAKLYRDVYVSGTPDKTANGFVLGDFTDWYLSAY